jgi:hypothetical protein
MDGEGREGGREGRRAGGREGQANLGRFVLVFAFAASSLAVLTILATV